MMMASTVWTLAFTTPFSPITSLPPTCSSPPTSHSIWIESAISNLPSILACSPTTVSSVMGVVVWPFVCTSGAAGLGASLRPSIDASSCAIADPERLRVRTRERTHCAAATAAPDAPGKSDVAPGRGGGQSPAGSGRGAPRGTTDCATGSSVGGPDVRRRSERADEPLDPFIVGLERVLAQDRLALRVVELQVDPVHAVVLALQVRLADELAAEPRTCGLRRLVLGA